MLLLWSLLLTGALATPSTLPIRLETKRHLDSDLANIHLTYSRNVDEPHFFTYGSCESDRPTEARHEIARHGPGNNSDRLVWIIPKDAEQDGCLSAWSEDDSLLGRSVPLKFGKMQKRSLQERSKVSIPMNIENGIDIEGAWFNGVTQLQGRDPRVNVTAAKNKEIAIVGAGMSGLMTFLNLRSSGFTNVKIIEASHHLGGRVRTKYLEGGPFDYQYQEMGPMRFPQNITYLETNETLTINDQKHVFLLADTLNELNKGDDNHTINFIPFIQSSPNELYYFNEIRKDDGTVPTASEIAANDSLVLPEPPDPVVDAVQAEVAKITNDPELLRDIVTNMFKAYKDFMGSGLNGLGGDDFSEFAYVHNYLGHSLNVTDQTLDGLITKPFFFTMFEQLLFGNPEWQTHWATIDGGISRLPEAFRPLIENNLTMGRKVERVEYLPENDGKVKLMWKEKYTDLKYQEETYDYAVVSAPFSVVRGWRLPRLSPTLSNAIQRLEFKSACKAILQFSTRFWEHLDQPIYGGSSVTDIPGISTVTYPSYQINSTGPGVVIASYGVYEMSEVLASLPEEEYVQYALNAMVELHGEIAREQYTGKYDTQCWNTDPYTSGGWTEPSIGQQTLYMPTYFKTENNMIFIGEHTSYTHSWVSSALESGIRGSVQLLLELGLVDEAKEVTNKWMARWINI